MAGGRGLAASASINPERNRPSTFEPVHGSAPDIAGQNVANPLASILSFAMMLRYSFDLIDEADLVESAVRQTLAAGIRTGDIARAGETRVSTRSMGDAVLTELEKAV